MIRDLRFFRGLTYIVCFFAALMLTYRAEAQLSVSIEKNDLICAGLPLGSAEATASGGATPYTFAWSNGADTRMIDRLQAGTYTVTVTDNNGDTATASTTLTEPPKLEVTLLTDECQLPTPITANASGGTGSYRYLWTTGDETQTIQVEEPGKYCVTVTDENLCGRVACIEINANPPNISLVVNDITCPGDMDGSIEAIVEGGTGNLTYSWSTGDTGTSLSGLGAGTYTLTVTDEEGCSDVASGTVDEPNPLTVVFDPESPQCPGDTTGSISGLVSGGTFPYQYLWNTGGTSLSLSNISAGTYVLTVTDANGCTLVDSMVVDNESNLSLELDARDETCPDENDGLIMANVTGGVAPYTYNWSNGANTPMISGLVPGAYQVTVTDALGCTLVSDSAVVAAAPDFVIDISVQPTSQPGAADGSATVTVIQGEGPFRYLWSTGDTTATVTDLSAGNYGVTVTRADGCEAVGAITILETEALLSIITAPENICLDDSSGAAQVQIQGGTSPYQILWSTGDTTTTISGLPAGDYAVTVTDANEVTASDTVSIGGFPQPTVTLDAPEFVCGGESLGAINLEVSGGTPGYTFAWNTGETSEDLENLGSGTYTVTVTDANGCQAIATARIEVVQAIDLSLIPRNLLCFEDNSGGVSATVTGGKAPLRFAWSTGDTTSQINGLPAGTYAVTVTDSVGCTAIDSITLTQPNEILVTGEVQDIICAEDSTGSIAIEISGGFEPYQIDWNTGAINDTLLNLQQGTYVVTITDATGCTQVDSFVVENPGVPQCGIMVTQPVSSPQATDGIATVNVVGGEMPYMIEWSNGEMGPVADSLGIGDYSVTVTDANGCTTTCAITLFPEAALVGDFVWLDENKDGTQDPGEPGIPGIEVILTPVGACDSLDMDTTVTNADGFYSFVVQPCDYKLTFVVPDSLSITIPNSTQNRELDSDIDRVMGMTDTFTIEEFEEDLTWDAGLFPKPSLAFTEGCNCLNNATDENNGQFAQTVRVVGSAIGDNWTLIAQEGMFRDDSPEPPASPLPLPIGTELTEVDFGVYELPFRSIDNQPYSATVTNGIDTLFVGGLCTYPDININNLPDGDLELCLTGGPLELDITTSVPGQVEILVNGNVVEAIDPLALGEGTHELVVNLFPDDDEECLATLVRQIIVLTEGCPAKLGDFVWLDENENGLQDPSESGVAAVTVILQQPDGTPLDTTMTDGTGMYMFMVDAGDYKLTFNKPSAFDLTTPNAGDDNRDSDVDPLTMMTAVVSLEEGEINNTIDAGLFAPCVNVTDPGEIGFDQMLCAPGNDPEPLVSVRPATGGEGELEYLWMFSEEDANFNMSTYQPIPNSNSETYDPGPLFKTTWFARCARRVGCPGFLEPEVIKITVKDEASADIIGPTVVCADDQVTYRVETKTGDPESIKWILPLGVTADATDQEEITLSFATFGQYRLRVEVTENGCTATGRRTLVATENPTYCKGVSLAIEADAMENTREVMVKWDMVDDGEEYVFEVQHSQDGQVYDRLARVTSPKRIENQVRYYEYMDEYPKVGRNYYRVLVTNRQGDQEFSEIVELRLGDKARKVMIYPNPVREELSIVFMEDMPTRMELELMNADGKIMRSFLVDGQTTMHNLNLGGLPSGMYFLRVKMSRDTTEVLKIWKME